MLILLAAIFVLHILAIILLLVATIDNVSRCFFSTCTSISARHLTVLCALVTHACSPPSGPSFFARLIASYVTFLNDSRGHATVPPHMCIPEILTLCRIEICRIPPCVCHPPNIRSILTRLLHSNVIPATLPNRPGGSLTPCKRTCGPGGSCRTERGTSRISPQDRTTRQVRTSLHAYNTDQSINTPTACYKLLLLKVDIDVTKRPPVVVRTIAFKSAGLVAMVIKNCLWQC